MQTDKEGSKKRVHMSMLCRWINVTSSVQVSFLVEKLCVCGLHVTVVGVMCKNLILLSCGHGTANEGLGVFALIKKHCSKCRGVPVTCHVPEEEDEMVSVQHYCGPSFIAVLVTALLSFLVGVWLTQPRPSFAFRAKGSPVNQNLLP